MPALPLSYRITIEGSSYFHLGLSLIANRWLCELMKGKKKAAHFLLIPELACSPQNEALISAYLDLGCEVDLFTPGGSCDVSAYGTVE